MVAAAGLGRRFGRSCRTYQGWRMGRVQKREERWQSMTVEMVWEAEEGGKTRLVVPLEAEEGCIVLTEGIEIGRVSWHTTTERLSEGKSTDRAWVVSHLVQEGC
jgi:hypothetical protein